MTDENVEKTTVRPLSDRPKVYVKLVGEDGNAFAIMGRVAREMRRAKWTPEEIKEYQDKAMSGDYDHLLATTMEYVEESEEDDEESEDDNSEEDE